MVTLFLLDVVSIRVNVEALVDRAYKVIDHQHQEPGILAKPNPLHRVGIDVPVKVLETLALLGLNHGKEEVEELFALALLFGVLVALQRHDFEVEHFSFALRVTNVDFDLFICLEKVLFQFLHVFLDED